MSGDEESFHEIEYRSVELRIIDEVLLIIALDVCTETIQEFELSNMKEGGCVWGVAQACVSIQNEVTHLLTFEIVIELIREVMDRYLAEKRQEHRLNPVVSIITTTIDEVLGDFHKSIAIEVCKSFLIIALLIYFIIVITLFVSLF